MLTNNEEGPNFIQSLPQEILIYVFSHLSILELARIQRTCKAWYTVAQNTTILWRKSEPFFKKYGLMFRGKTTEFLQGVQTLSRLSAGKLDEIFASLDTQAECDGEIALFLQTIPSFNPISLQIEMYGDYEKYLPIIGRCKSLRELDLETYGASFKANFFKDCPIQEAKLEKLTLNQDSFNMRRSDRSCLSVSSSIKTLILNQSDLDDMLEDMDTTQVFEFLQHCRESIECIVVIGGHWSMRQEITGLRQEIVLPNMVKAQFLILDEERWADEESEESRPLYCLKCPQIQELHLPCKYFLKLFHSLESVKRVEIAWEVNNLEEIFYMFSNLETLKSKLYSEDMLRTLVNLVPKQIKHLILTVSCQVRYDGESKAEEDRRLSSHHLLDLIKKASTITQVKNLFLLRQEGDSEFCYITMKYIGPTKCGLGRDISISMCKHNFVEAFTELSNFTASSTANISTY